MINATTAANIATTVQAGGTPSSVPSTERQGNTLLDMANLAVVFASMRGENTTYVSVDGLSLPVINGAIGALQSLGFNVNRDRERYYKEIVLTW